jgi:hypothetical protein
MNGNLNILFGGFMGNAPLNDVWSYSPYCAPAPKALTPSPNGGGWTAIPNAGKSIPVRGAGVHSVCGGC